MRIDKFLVSQNICTRKEAQKLVRKGLVKIDSEIVKKPETKLDPNINKVTVDGKEISYQEYVYIIMNKPKGYVTTASDPHAEKTVMDLLKKCSARVFPVGRLDKDTEGLLLLTNDGDLAHRILSPRHGVWKRYYAEHEGTAGPADVRAFEAGLVLADGLHCLPAKLTPLGPGRSVVEVQEGKYHQVRRMLASRGLPVTYLRREAEGRLTLGNLPLGQTKELNIVEAEQLLLNIL